MDAGNTHQVVAAVSVNLKAVGEAVNDRCADVAVGVAQTDNAPLILTCSSGTESQW